MRFTGFVIFRQACFRYVPVEKPVDSVNNFLYMFVIMGLWKPYAKTLYSKLQTFCRILLSALDGCRNCCFICRERWRAFCFAHAAHTDTENEVVGKMLYIAKSLRDLNFGALMEVYREGNLENAKEFWPELPQGQGILWAEQEFYQYLREDFFSTDGGVYALWQENEKYISALRLEPYRDGLLLEALETAPEYRRRGYAGRLILAVLSQLQPKKVYSHVSKQNTASLSVHEKCGFQRILDYAVYIDGSVNQRAVTMCYEHK